MRQYVILPSNRIGLYFPGGESDYMSMTREQRDTIKRWYKWNPGSGLWESRKWNMRSYALKAAIDLGFTENTETDRDFRILTA
jgi:hypothetical protein